MTVVQCNYFLRLGIQHPFKLHITLQTVLPPLRVGSSLHLLIPTCFRPVWEVPLFLRSTGSLPPPWVGRVTAETLLVLPRRTGEGPWNLRLSLSTISLVSNVICNLKGCCTLSPKKIKISQGNFLFSVHISGEDLLSTDLQYCDNYLLLAAHMLIDMLTTNPGMHYQIFAIFNRFLNCTKMVMIAPWHPLECYMYNLSREILELVLYFSNTL